MCGIAGLVAQDSENALTARVQEATRRLAHRGPDGTGIFSQAAGARDGSLVLDGRPSRLAPRCCFSSAVAIGHSRLRIIDLSDAAAQPFVSADGRYVLAFNGEIYNYRELRDELRRLGAEFRTTSDTEVLLAAWERWSEDCLPRITGMFAFAVLDRADGVLTLARDAFGMKPLYYSCVNSEVAFASEIGAVLSLRRAPAVAEPSAVATYLASGGTDRAGATMFSGIKAIPPAHLLRLHPGSATSAEPVRWWTPELSHEDRRPRAEIIDGLRDAVLDSVRLHLRSDVPVATMLSGGLDSSAIVASARRVGGPGFDLRTYSYVPDDGVRSEARWIDAVTQATGARGVIVRPSHLEWEAAQDRLVAAQGEPFGSPAIFVQWQLFAAASGDGVRVMLDGQGADELFGGYASAHAARMAAHLRRGEWLSVARMAGGGRSGWRGATLRGAIGVLARRQVSAVRQRLGAPAMGGLAREAWFRERGVGPSIPGRLEETRSLQRGLWRGAAETSLPALLRYADRSAMSVSVEGRLPFLTTGLATLALSLPDSMLVDDAGTGKRALRDAMRGIVPDVVLDRTDKVGFGVPLERWLATSVRAHADVADAASLPCVDGRVAGRLALLLRLGRTLSPAETMMGWRLAGLSAWSRVHDVRFS